MMLTRLCADTFVRCFGDVGYITSQLTKADRLFDASGAVFLSALSRQPQTDEEIAATIARSFIGVTPADILPDLREFLDQLAADGFIVRGASPAELDAIEPRFSYARADAIRAEKLRLGNPLDADAATAPSDTQTELSLRTADRPLLLNLQVEFTSACNERCRHCYLPPNRPQRHAPAALVRKAIDEYAAMGGLAFTIGGGECLLHPQFIELLEYARARDLSVSVLSNLTRLDDRLLDALRAARLSQLQVSVYSLVPAEHDHITNVPGSLTQTLAAIEKLVAADIPVQISCPVMRTNYASYKDVIAWAQGLGMKVQADFIMMARSDFTTDNLAERLDDAQTCHLLRDILATDKHYNELLEDWHDPLDIANAPVCGVGRDTLTVGADGSCYPCAGWQGMKVGDLNTQSLADIWWHSPKLAMLRRITKGDFPQCLVCPDRHYCAMCLVRNFNESGGDMMVVAERFCRVARLNREVVEEWKRQRGAAITA